jgi:hypothetical protein
VVWRGASVLLVAWVSATCLTVAGTWSPPVGTCNVRFCTLYDQLDLTLQVLVADWPEAEPLEALPANVVSFHPL